MNEKVIRSKYKDRILRPNSISRFQSSVSEIATARIKDGEFAQQQSRRSGHQRRRFGQQTVCTLFSSTLPFSFVNFLNVIWRYVKFSNVMLRSPAVNIQFTSEIGVKTEHELSSNFFNQIKVVFNILCDLKVMREKRIHERWLCSSVC